MDDMALVKLLEQEAASWDLRICPGARHPDAVNRNAHAKRRADLLRSAAATITAWNTRAASGGDSASLEQRAHDLFWALMQAPYADTTIGNIVCAETTPQRLESAWIPLLTAALANQQGVGEPDEALLISMATCLNHGFGLLPWPRQQSMLSDMRKLWDEVMGRGFYTPERRDFYLGMRATQPAGDVGSQPVSKSVARRLAVQRGEGEAGKACNRNCDCVGPCKLGIEG